MPDANTAWTILASVLVALIGIAVAYLQGWLESPRRRDEREKAAAAAARNEAMADAMLGEPEVRDLAGGIIKQKVPGMVDRVSTLEVGFALMADQKEQLSAMTTEVRSLRHDVDLLKAGTIEKAAIRMENAGLFDMIAKRDSEVVDGDST